MISPTPLIILKERIYRTFIIGLRYVKHSTNSHLFLITSEIKEELKITTVQLLDEIDYFCILLDIFSTLSERLLKHFFLLYEEKQL